MPLLLINSIGYSMFVNFIGLVHTHVKYENYKYRLLYFIIQFKNEPIYPFLNNLLTALVEANVSFLATAFFAIFCLYLLWATIKGNIKFGLRVFLCWSLHPMK